MKSPEKLKYSAVIDYLYQYITERNLSPGDKLPTEKELMEKVGVSRVTVQRALKEMISQDIIRRVQGSGTYVSDHFHPLASAELPVHYIPMILADEQGAKHAYQMIQGADRFLSAHSCYLSVHFSHMSPEEERALISRLVENGARCIIVFPCSAAENRAFYFRLIQEGIRLIFIDRLPAGLPADLVTCDNYTGGYMAAKHLLDGGRKRIGFLSIKPLSEASSLSQRLEGYRSALEHSSAAYREELVCFSNRKEIPFQLENMMRRPDRPDGLFCVNDLTAVEVMKSLAEQELLVPMDVAVIGFDNLPITSNLAVPLSEVEQSFFQLGYEAAEIAHRIVNHQLEYIVQKILPVKLVARESTMPVGG